MNGEHGTMVVFGGDINSVFDINTHHGCAVNVVNISNVTLEVFLGT